MGQAYCAYCGSHITRKNHCPFCGQPHYDEMYGHRERRQAAERHVREMLGLACGPRFFEPSFVNATVQGVASDPQRKKASP